MSIFRNIYGWKRTAGVEKSIASMVIQLVISENSSSTPRNIDLCITLGDIFLWDGNEEGQCYINLPVGNVKNNY